MALRKELQAIVEALLKASASTKELTLDAIGEAIGARVISAQEIEAMMKALEARAITIVAPEGGAGEERLKAVLTAARSLGPELGRKPTVAEIATRAGLTEEGVRHALALAKVMQR